MAAKKTAAKKTTREAAPKKTTKKAAGKRLRGRALAEVVIAHLRGPKSPIGEPRPLSAEQRARCERAMGVALSPFMDAVFSFDVGWLARTVGLFDDHDAAQVAPCIEVIREHARVFTDSYAPWCAGRLTGKAAQLDAGSDSMRFLYLGAPDEEGEYPVLCIDHDDVPFLGVEHAGFDLWMAASLGLPQPDAARLAREASKRILGMAGGSECGPCDVPDFDALPELAPAPGPGSVTHAPLAVGAPGGRPRALTAAQIAKALGEVARAGRVDRLRALLADARERGVPGKALDDALVEACLGKQGACMRALLDAGASPNARDYYGGALTRLITYGGDVELVRALLDAGASPDSPGVNGETAIFQSIARGDEAIARLLVARGADVNHLANNELTALHTAVRAQPDPRFVDILCEAGARTDASKKQSPVLVWAAQQASVEHVRRIVAHGAPLDQRAAYLKQTALHAAFAYGRDDVAAALVQAGADRGLRDARGISLERIYGPGGDDARPVSIRYAPSADPQTLRLAIDVAVTNQHQAPRAWFPAIEGAHWARLVAAGAGAEADFAPEASRAEVVQPADKTGLAKAGFHHLEIVLRVAGVSAGFIRWMCLSLLGGTRVLTGAGAESVLRVVALDAEGSRGGGAAVDLPALRAWAQDGAAPGVWPAPLPFELTVRPGPAAELVVVPRKTPRGPVDLVDLIQQAIPAWTALLERVPCRPDADPRFSLLAIPREPDSRVVRFALIDVLGRKNEQQLRLPWSTESAAAQLGQVMRAVHARVPLARVELVLPQA